MNKIERVTGALKGEDVDRPPFSFWYHFGLQHLPGRDHAEAEMGFYRAYDLDFLKVMNDYPYPLPESVDSLETEEDWKWVEPIKSGAKCWDEQLTALSIINDQIGGEALFIETIFSPWTTARRLASTRGWPASRERFPETVLQAMDNISTSLAGYAKEAIARGASGIFLSLGAATHDLMTPADYQVWGRPFDLKILEAVRDAPFNVMHIHGKRIHFDSLLDYPVSAINWSHFATDPSLKEGQIMSGKTALGGIDETAAAHLSVPEIMTQVRDSISKADPRGLIVTPGCSVPTDTPERNLRAIKGAVAGKNETGP